MYDNREYKILKKLARKYLDAVLNASVKEDTREFMISTLILGNGILNVQRNPAGDHNYHAALDELYDHKRKHPTSNIDKMVDNAIKNYLIRDSLFNLKCLDRAIGIYDYILKSEKDHNASFQLEVGNYLKLTEQVLNNGTAEINSKVENITQWFADKKQYLQKKYDLQL